MSEKGVTATLALFDSSALKQEVFDAARENLRAYTFRIVQLDDQRPWGGFLRVADEQADDFIQTYFAGVELPENARYGKRSPKILIVAPQARLSWQYHDRRSEVWRGISGSVGVAVSETNEEPPAPRVLEVGETIAIPQGLRHRLIGLETWGAVAEIWIHIDPHNPSDEEDIYRLADDFGRG